MGRKHLGANLGKNDNESYLDYRRRILDPVSGSFCLAKWYNSTIWLGSGTTASCHLPPAHKIPLSEIEENPSAIHNTQHKKVMRAQMLAGEKPEECEYCWKIEGIKKDNLSDRVFKSAFYSDEDAKLASSTEATHNFIPRTIEIAFERTCNFACSYCNASFSTKWGQDIRENGVYKNLRSDGGGAYRHNGDWAEPYRGVENPYVTAFWKWWPELSKDLKELRVTGGEPLLSNDVWKLFDYFATEARNDLKFAVNSNLGAPDALIDRLIEKSQKLNNLDIYTSCESVGEHAEYIRDGLNYSKYISNLEKIMRSAKYQSLHLMVTANSLCLFKLTEFLDQLLVWKKQFGPKAPHFIVNILRFPSFMSPLVLPEESLQKIHEQLSTWYELNKDNHLLSEAELGTFKRLIDYIDEVKTPHKNASNKQDLERDFKNFFEQYDKRRKKSFVSCFPQLADWFNKISADPFDYPGGDFVDGDSTKGWHNLERIKEVAKKHKLNSPY